MRPNNVICSYIYNHLSISNDLDWIIQAKVAIFIRCSAASEKHFHHWAVEMTFLTPPLDFDQSGHTQPTLRHHGSIYVDRFGYDAANRGEMNHRRRRHGKTFSPLGGGDDILHSPTRFRPIRSHPTIAKTSWIDLRRSVWVRRR